MSRHTARSFPAGARIVRKKLIASARRWFSSGGGPDEAQQDAAAFGLDADFAEPDLVVVPEAWPALTLFLETQTQWRLAPSGSLAGLDYDGVKAAADGTGAVSREVFDGIRLMERIVLEEQEAAE